MNQNTFYISITGLQLKRFWHFPKFAWHSVKSMKQAQAADGNISSTAKKINGVYHTLTIWEDETAMKRFLYRGAHREAIAAFGSIATGKTFGYASSEVPNWDKVHLLWQQNGKDYAV